MASVPFFAKRFVSGTALPDAASAALSLNEKGISASLDLLGENITKESEAQACADEYVRILECINSQKINAHVSLKLTMLGLDISQDLSKKLLSQVLTKADEINCRVALDMEGSAYTERTLATYEWACKLFKSPEAVLQAYLKRTPEDMMRVIEANGKFRLCKGAYKETAEVAFQSMADIRRQYLKLAELALPRCNHICLATHDDELINSLKLYISTNSIPKSKYEFQMLYGMREKTWSLLAQEGHPFTVYLPYGEHWQAYYSRRLTERKENVFFVLKNMFKG
jgi:proline dehydrogenase